MFIGRDGYNTFQSTAISGRGYLHMYVPTQYVRACLATPSFTTGMYQGVSSPSHSY